MPSGGDPPDPVLTASLVTTLRTFGYDSTQFAYTSGATKYWLFVERVTGTIDRAEWFYATDAEGGVNPKFLVPQLTFDVIKNGTYNTGTGTITYSGSNYRIRLYRDVGAGKQLAQAVVV